MTSDQPTPPTESTDTARLSSRVTEQSDGEDRLVRHIRLIPQNPFLGLAMPAYMIGGFTLAVAEPKPWAWMVWVPWLLIVTIIPIVWHVRNLPNGKDEGR